MACPLCGRDRDELGGYCSACAFYVIEVLGIDGSFDRPIRYGTTRISPIVRYLAPRCYLCGEAPTEHAEHVIPIALGGPHTWANLGGACGDCNATKGDRVLEPSEEQAARLAEQQAAIRAALDAIDREPDSFWLAYYDDQIDMAVEDLTPYYLDDPASVTRDDIKTLGMSFEIDRANYPLLPQSAIDAVCDAVLARLARI